MILCIALSALCIFSGAEEAAQKVQIHDYIIPNDSAVRTLSTNVIMYCKDTGTVMYHKNGNRLIEPGSFVKVMVGALALELYRDRLDERIIIDGTMISGSSGLSIQLEPGESVTVRDLLYGLMLMGANDAAMTLSRLQTGKTEDFVQLMNEKAKAIGMENTVYKNVTGLHAEGMLTTLNDTLKVIDYAAGVEGFLTVTSTEKYEIPENTVKDKRTLITRNCLLSKYRDDRYKTEEVTGMNYGSTAEAGECLIATVNRDGMTYYIAISGGYVTRDTEKDLTVFKDTQTLIAHAEEGYIYSKVLSAKRSYGQIGVKYNSISNYADIYPVSDAVLYLPKYIDPDKDIEYRITAYERQVPAPIKEGTVVAKLCAYYDGVKLCTVPMAVGEDIEQNRILYFLEKMESIYYSPFFLTSIFVFLSSMLIWWVITMLIDASRKRRKNRLR